MARSGLIAPNRLLLGLAPLRRRRLGGWLTVALVVLGPVFAIATAFTLNGANDGLYGPQSVRAVLLADLVYILVIVALITWTIARAIAARRKKSAGSKLHLRLAGLFTLVALAPTVLVAVFATLTVNFGVEAWFSSQVGSVVRNALTVAEAYGDEHRGSIRGDALAMANDINRAASIGIDGERLAELVRSQQLIREMPEAYVLDGDGRILARGEFSYLFTLEVPTPEQFAAARSGEVVVIDDESANELRALVYLTGLIDSYLFVTRRVSGEVLMLLDETRETVSLYEHMERERGRVLFDFALLYLGFAVIVMLASVWLGLWFAERLAKPIGRLAGAAQRVGGGDFEVRVKEERGDDEIALLSRVFNRMTKQVKRQRDALVEMNRETETRRRFMETVLSSVSAGVVGLDRDGRVELMNAAAFEMLGASRMQAAEKRLDEIAPELSPMLERAARSASGAARDEISLAERALVARVTPKAGGAGEGSVVTIDDMTELVAAQRMAAWGDIARRIAHEIKNPLTPIRLSADRLRRKFDKLDEPDRSAWRQYADVIARQADDIRRMVDEFSRFARMPAPERRPEDLVDIARGAALLQKGVVEDAEVVLEAPDSPLTVSCDRGLIAQALTNLLKNALESVGARLAAGEDDRPGLVRLTVRAIPGGAEVLVADNGVGLPEMDRARLTEPYVTTREKGTGLGLAIVKKIVEQHGGALTIGPAPPFEPDAPEGALVRFTLPNAHVAPIKNETSP